jgi:hypothetical protein
MKERKIINYKVGDRVFHHRVGSGHGPGVIICVGTGDLDNPHLETRLRYTVKFDSGYQACYAECELRRL